MIAENYLINKEYQQALQSYEALINKKIKDPSIYRRVVATNIVLKRYDKAKEVSEMILADFTPIPEDFINAGFLKVQENAHDEAIDFYKKALELNSEHAIALNNVGASLSYGFNKHEESLEYFNKAISIDPDLSHAYIGRGYAKIKLGRLDDGLIDIKHALQLDDLNSFAHVSLGIYYFEKNELTEAKICFEKAKEIDSDAYLLNEYLEKVK